MALRLTPEVNFEYDDSLEEEELVGWLRYVVYAYIDQWSINSDVVMLFYIVVCFVDVFVFIPNSFH